MVTPQLSEPGVDIFGCSSKTVALLYVLLHLQRGFKDGLQFWYIATNDNSPGQKLGQHTSTNQPTVMQHEMTHWSKRHNAYWIIFL